MSLLDTVVSEKIENLPSKLRIKIKNAFMNLDQINLKTINQNKRIKIEIPKNNKNKRLNLNNISFFNNLKQSNIKEYKHNYCATNGLYKSYNNNNNTSYNNLKLKQNQLFKSDFKNKEMLKYLIDKYEQKNIKLKGLGKIENIFNPSVLFLDNRNLFDYICKSNSHEINIKSQRDLQFLNKLKFYVESKKKIKDEYKLNNSDSSKIKETYCNNEYKSSLSKILKNKDKSNVIKTNNSSSPHKNNVNILIKNVITNHNSVIKKSSNINSIICNKENTNNKDNKKSKYVYNKYAINNKSCYSNLTNDSRCINYSIKNNKYKIQHYINDSFNKRYNCKTNLHDLKNKTLFQYKTNYSNNENLDENKTTIEKTYHNNNINTVKSLNVINLDITNNFIDNISDYTSNYFYQTKDSSNITLYEIKSISKLSNNYISSKSNFYDKHTKTLKKIKHKTNDNKTNYNIVNKYKSYECKLNNNVSKKYLILKKEADELSNNIKTLEYTKSKNVSNNYEFNKACYLNKSNSNIKIIGIKNKNKSTKNILLNNNNNKKNKLLCLQGFKYPNISKSLSSIKKQKNNSYLKTISRLNSNANKDIIFNKQVDLLSNCNTINENKNHIIKPKKQNKNTISRNINNKLLNNYISNCLKNDLTTFYNNYKTNKEHLLNQQFSNITNNNLTLSKKKSKFININKSNKKINKIADRLSIDERLSITNEEKKKELDIIMNNIKKNDFKTVCIMFNDYTKKFYKNENFQNNILK